MSFQAYLDNIKSKTGKTPQEFKEYMTEKNFLKEDLKATEFIEFLAKEFGLGRGHSMALWAIFKSSGWVQAKKKNLLKKVPSIAKTATSKKPTK